jgi:ADP-heptose:LPS heptosyltransferase
VKTWACVVRVGGCGDNLIASSVLPGLKDKFDCIEVIARAPNHVVFENNPYIDRLVVWPEDEPPMDALAWQRMLAKRAREYSAFFNLSHSCEGWLVFMEGQTQFWWPDKIRRELCDRSYLSMVHDICDVPHHFAPMFYPTDREVLQAYDTVGRVRSMRPGPVIGWVLSGSRVDKSWPFAHLCIGRLISELGANVIMLGAPNQRDFEMAKAIQEQVRMQNSSDVGLHLAMSSNDEKKLDWPLRRVLTQAQYVDTLVTPDTGPAWSTALLPVPKVVLVSHASQKNITTGWKNTITLHADPARVPCWPCHRLHDSFETCHKAPDANAALCMSDISTQAVLDAVRQSLALRGMSC